MRQEGEDQGRLEGGSDGGEEQLPKNELDGYSGKMSKSTSLNIRTLTNSDLVRQVYACTPSQNEKVNTIRNFLSFQV